MKEQGKWLAGALGVVAALGAGAARATEVQGALYGDLRLSFDYVEDRTGTAGPAYAGTDNQSVWGIKVATSRGGVNVFGGYERFIDADDPAAGVPVEVTRLAYLGLTSQCGTLKAGRHATAYSEAGRKLDPFYNTAAAGTYGIATAGSIFGGGNSHGSSTGFNADILGAAIAADHFSYRSPSFAGFSGNVALFLDDQTGSADQDHGYGAGVEYLGHGVTAGLQYIDASGANDLTWGTDTGAARLYAGYAHTRFGAGASWERHDLPGATTANYLMVSGWYGIFDGTRIAVSVGVEDDSATEGDSQRIGIFHDVIEDFTVWAAARRYNGPASTDADVITVGASYKFNLGFSDD
jgi:hypothetical protein